MTECLFCKIVAGELPSETVGSGDGVIAVRDVAPRAPVHVLVLTERHIGSAHELGDRDGDVLSAAFRLARQVADDEGIADAYRVTTNVGRGGGQTIDHLHFHVLGGRQLGHIDTGEPPA